jgi:hypothetical protein
LSAISLNASPSAGEREAPLDVTGRPAAAFAGRNLKTLASDFLITNSNQSYEELRNHSVSHL